FRILSETSGVDVRTSANVDLREFATRTIVIKVALRVPGWEFVIAYGLERDVICGVARNEFVEQTRGNGASQASNHAHSGTGKEGLRGWEAGRVPDGTRLEGCPRIVDVAESQALVVGDVVIDPNQFFAPVGRQVDRVVVDRLRG